MLIVAVYVDDLLLISNSISWLSYFKEEFKQRFSLQDMGEIKHCLGMNSNQGGYFLEIFQSGYIEDI